MPQRSQTSLNVCSQKTALMNKYGNRRDFLTAFNPDKQGEICKDKDGCFFGEYPTLAQLRAYGDSTPSVWLITQLYNLSEYCGCKDKLTSRQYEECASLIEQEFSFLKVSEVMLFFRRFKMGRYGKFYGAVDPLTIGIALRSFLDERAFTIQQKENEKRSAQRELWARNSVSHAEAVKTEEYRRAFEGR